VFDSRATLFTAFVRISTASGLVMSALANHPRNLPGYCERMASILSAETLRVIASSPTDIKPVLPTPAAAFESADRTLASAEPVDAWWTTFGDPRITSLVEQALNRSPDVRQAAALVRLARARMREQEGANWPLGGARAGYDYKGDS
jgi:hypothetical protein